ncbi:MAG: cardiolipin synthase, partial [Clostridiales bacterium]|nr:cardiolipin synthase [Clostridiales bacterium]
MKKFLFHRITLILVAVVLQLLVLTVALVVLRGSFAYFYGGSILVSFIALLWIINNNSNPAYKIAWIIPILVFPLLGGLFYIFFGGNKLTKKERSRMSLITRKTKEVLPAQSKELEELASLSERAAIQSRYISNASAFPLYKGTSSRYFPLGDDVFAVMLEELKKARRFIFLEFFIIQEGLMWDSILDILVEKAAAGVEVRVIYDDFGCLMTLPHRYNEQLQRMGIKCHVFNPLIPVISPRHNHRDHRKLLVVDGHTGFTGGINLSDEYINKKVRFGHWKDTAIMLKGEAVWSLTAMFLSMWGYLDNSTEDFEKFMDNDIDISMNSSIDSSMDKDSDMDSVKEIQTDNGGTNCDGFIQPYADSPLDEEFVGETIYMNLINKAQKYVYIT